MLSTEIGRLEALRR